MTKVHLEYGLVTVPNEAVLILLSVKRPDGYTDHHGIVVKVEKIMRYLPDSYKEPYEPCRFKVTYDSCLSQDEVNCRLDRFLKERKVIEPTMDVRVIVYPLTLKNSSPNAN